MEFITATMFSGILYDMFKHGLHLTAENIKANLKEWIVEDTQVAMLESSLKQLEISQDMNAVEIEKSLTSSKSIMEILETIKPNRSVIQIHSGEGDNIAGDKIIQ